MLVAQEVMVLVAQEVVSLVSVPQGLVSLVLADLGLAVAVPSRSCS